MRTVDRIIATGIRPPLWHSGRTAEYPASSGARPVRGQVAYATADEETRRAMLALGRMPVVDLTGFAARHRAVKTAFIWGEARVHLPWPAMLMEYPSHSGRQRRAVVVQDVTHAERVPGSARAEAIVNAGDQGCDPADVTQLVELALLVEDERHTVAGPQGWIVLALDAEGRDLGNRWAVSTPDGPRLVIEVEPAEWLPAAMYPSLLALSAMRDPSALEHHVPDERSSAAHRRRTGKKPRDYWTIREAS